MSRAEFTSFTFTYSDNPPRYTYAYTYATEQAAFEIDAYINGQLYDRLLNQASGSISIPKSASPKYFFQGTTIDAYLNCPEDSVSSSNIYGIFQCSNDSNNIYLGSNTTFVTCITKSANVKSVILPPIRANPYSQFTFKYLNDESVFIICPYMSNVSYPIATNTFTTTNSLFQNVFDSKLGGSFSNSVVETSNYKASITLMSDSSNWNYINLYYTDMFTPTTSASFNGAITNTNSQLLYYNYTTGSTQSTFILQKGISNRKYVFIRNTSADNVNFIISGASGSGMEATGPSPGLYAYINVGISTNTIRCVGLFYNSNTDTFIITSDANATNLLKTTYPTSPISFSNEVGIINDQPKNIRLVEPIQEVGYARFNTILSLNTQSNSVVVGAPASNTSNVIILQDATEENQVALTNNGGNFSYTFATFYLNSSKTSVTIPLFSFVS